MVRPADQIMPEVEQNLIDPARRAAEGLATIWEPAALPADSFPGYFLIREIHRGGQGVVYQATQKTTNRAVAIKVMREGPFAGPRDKIRFEREVQILGQLVHPNIVTIHDSGVASGSFFFVMDYVAGRTLDDYGVQHGHSVRQVLQLFAKICEAVHVAHLRGVIHRDLKPSNIRIDANGEPRVLDFGLAKDMSDSGDRAGEPSSLTVTGQFVGSLPWASPEQAAGSSDAIDMRTDVYSLGVILFRLLSGRFPYEVAGQMRDLLNNILTAEPPRPSAIRKEINDEVDTIVLKCLSKEPARRYQSAGELARDIRHYLAGEPIEAKQDSGWYLLRKGMQRYRAATAVTVVILILIGASFLILSYMYRSVLRERDRAVESDKESEAVTSFLGGMLNSVDPAKKGQDVKVRDILDAASESIATSFSQQPLVEARLRNIIGATYLELGLLDRAESQLIASAALFEREKGKRDPSTISTRNTLANAMISRGDYDEAEASMRVSAERSRRDVGLEHPQTLGLMSAVANAAWAKGRFEEAERLHRERLPIEQKVFGENHVNTLKTMNNLGIALNGMGRHAEAEEQLRKTLELQRPILGPEHPQTLGLMNNLGTSIEAQGRFKEAEELYRTALETQRRTLGEEHPATLQSLGNLANCVASQGYLVEAVQLHRKALEVSRRVLGDPHPETWMSMANLAQSLNNAGHLSESEALHAQVLEGMRRKLGKEHRGTLLALHNLGFVWGCQGRYSEAETLLREALDGQQCILGDLHPDTLRSMSNLGEVLENQGRYSDAADFYRSALEARRKEIGPDHPETLWVMTRMASLASRIGNIEESQNLYGEATELSRARTQIPAAAATDFASLAALLLESRGNPLFDPDAALPASLRAVELSGRQDFSFLATLAKAYHLTGQTNLAVQTQRSALALLPPEPTLLRAEMESGLGDLLVATKNYAEAEPLLVDSFEWARELLRAPHRISEFIQRIVRLYDAWDAADPDKGHDEKAAKYRGLLGVS